MWAMLLSRGASFKIFILLRTFRPGLYHVGSRGELRCQGLSLYLFSGNAGGRVISFFFGCTNHTVCDM